MAPHPLCRECKGTGWIPYSSETLDDKLEEAYRLCLNCYTPYRCIGSKSGHPCLRPGTLRYGIGYHCKEHVERVRADEEVDHAYEAIYYLRYWLQLARDKADELLEMQLSEALGKAETWLRHVEQELDQA